MLKEEVDLVFPLIDVAETGQIDKKAMMEWVVNFYSLSNIPKLDSITSLFYLFPIRHQFYCILVLNYIRWDEISGVSEIRLSR